MTEGKRGCECVCHVGVDGNWRAHGCDCASCPSLAATTPPEQDLYRAALEHLTHAEEFAAQPDVATAVSEIAKRALTQGAAMIGRRVQMMERSDLWCDVEEARRKLELVARANGSVWPCPHCGATRLYGHEADDWWSADVLCEAAGVDGAAAMIALNDLVSKGLMEQNSQLRVRWLR